MLGEFEHIEGLAIIAGLFSVAVLARRLGRRPRRGDRAAVAGRHARYQAKGERVRAALASIDPRANPGRVIAYLRTIPPLAFEELILSELRDRGHMIRRSARYSGDGGADGEWDLNGRLWLVQAKRYSRTVRPEHVAAFDALCRRRGARGLFVHTGRTGPASRAAEAASQHIRIISGGDLVRFVAGEQIALSRQANN